MYFHNVHNNLHGEIENTQKRGGGGPGTKQDSGFLCAVHVIFTTCACSTMDRTLICTMLCDVLL